MVKSASVFGITRGGSSISTRLLQILAQGSGWSLNDIGGVAYANGVPINEVPASDFEKISKENTLIGPFREVPRHAAPILGDDIKKVVVFRDPRDCLVSHYFAFKNIHSVFKAGQTTDKSKGGKDITVSIDEYVISKVGDFIGTYRKYLDICKDEELARLYRYEDIAFRPSAWLTDVIKFLEMNPGNNAINQAALEAHFWRVGSDDFSHNRQGQSGDFINQLKPETIEVLNKEFADILDELEYPAVPKSTVSRFEDELSGVSRGDFGAQLIYEQRIQIDELKRTMLNFAKANGALSLRVKKLEEELEKRVAAQ